MARRSNGGRLELVRPDGTACSNTSPARVHEAEENAIGSADSEEINDESLREGPQAINGAASTVGFATYAVAALGQRRKATARGLG